MVLFLVFVEKYIPENELAFGEKNIGNWPFRIIAIRYWAHLLPKSGGDVRQATEKINIIRLLL